MLLEQLEQMAAALGATFAPFCEVVVHDLTRPKHSIVTLHNPLSGRQVGDPATDHGQRRISDPTYPQRGLRFAVMGAGSRRPFMPLCRRCAVW